MTTTRAFLFVPTELSDDDAYPLVFVDTTNQQVDKQQPCRIDQLLQAIDDYPLTVIIPDRLASLHKVTLPMLSDKKARAAIPYALEDAAAQEVADLHFAFDPAFYDTGQYLVLSCEKQWLQALIALLHNHGIEPKHITTAWFALANNQCVIHEQALLCRTETINGAFPSNAWPMIKSQFTFSESLSILQFIQDVEIPEEWQKVVTTSSQDWESWVSERLAGTNFITFNQGTFAPQQAQATLRRSAWLLGTSFVIWLLIWLTTNLLTLHHANKAIEQIDEEIAVIYRQFFPGANQIISPKFRIRQKLKSLATGDRSGLLYLLDQLAAPLQESQVTLVQLTYQNNRMSLKLMANDFNQLEIFMNRLKKQSAKAKQVNANRNEDKVEATVELQA